MGSDDDKRVTCCLCRGEVDSPSGWCPNCATYPINITPIRYCDRAHPVTVGGWCAQCGAYVLTELDPQPGEWVDTGRRSRKLTKAEVQTMVAHIVATLSGPGWPEKDVPLREDMIPRRWKRGTLQKIGMTPLGFPIVLPASEPNPHADGEVPF